MKIPGSLFAATSSILLAYADDSPAAPRHSFLLFILDDLRAELNAEDGRNLLQTPNLDQLAARGVKFDRAYCQVLNTGSAIHKATLTGPTLTMHFFFVQYALCSPSRSSFLTGLRPDTTRVFDLTTHFRENIPRAATLPQTLKEAGYRTIGLGKVRSMGLSHSSRLSSWGPLCVYSNLTMSSVGRHVRCSTADWATTSFLGPNPRWALLFSRADCRGGCRFYWVARRGEGRKR